MLTISRPANGLGSPLSGIGTPALSTRIELSDIEAGLLSVATSALKLASMIIKKRMDVKIIPVIVARVYFKKFFIVVMWLKK
jgi:hypothetical protein